MSVTSAVIISSDFIPRLRLQRPTLTISASEIFSGWLCCWFVVPVFHFSKCRVPHLDISPDLLVNLINGWITMITGNEMSTWRKVKKKTRSLRSWCVKNIEKYTVDIDIYIYIVVTHEVHSNSVKINYNCLVLKVNTTLQLNSLVAKSCNIFVLQCGTISLTDLTWSLKVWQTTAPWKDSFEDDEPMDFIWFYR